MLSYLILPISLLGIIAIEAMGLQLIVGGAGMLTLGHTAFFAIGGYASGAFALFLGPALGIHQPILLLAMSMGFAIVCTTVCALLVAIPCLRLRGDYLAVATMGFGQIVENVLNNIPQFGGASGFTNIPKLSSIALIWTIVLITAFTLKRFYQTGIGQSILCSRDDEIVARCFGISPEKSKLIAFMVGNAITAIAGSLYVHTFLFISPVAAGFQKSVEILLAVVIGGMFSIRGALIGATILVLVPELLRFLPHHIGWLQNLAGSYGLSGLSQFFTNVVQNSMLLFSIIVLYILKKNPSGVNALINSLRKNKHEVYS